LIIASLTAERKHIDKALRIVAYHMKRNADAYFSHKKRKLIDFNVLKNKTTL
jgi:hypothetical protein